MVEVQSMMGPTVARNIVSGVYRAVLPEKLRAKLWILRRDTKYTLYDLRWMAMTPRQRSLWTDKCLEPGTHYWLFILGCNNSGTTLLHNLLAARPLMRKLPWEGQLLTKAIANSAGPEIGGTFSKRLDLFRWTEASDASCLARLRYDWAAKFESGPGVLLEKSPPNILRSRWLQQHFQPSRFLAIVRHPYAVCEGIVRRRNRSIEEAATHWNCVHDILEQDLRHLRCFHRIKYEELCEQPLETLKKIEQLYQLEPLYDERIVQRPVPTHNITEVPRTIENKNQKSIRRLSHNDIETINDIAGEQMTKLGYDFA